MKALRWLLLPHYLYFLSLPSLALVATAMLGEQRGVGSMCLFGLVPVAVFIALMAYCYTLPRNGLEVLIVVFAVPLQLAAGCWGLGDGDVWRFIAQVTAVEIGAFACALGYVELRQRPLTTGRASAFWLALCALLLLLSNSMPFMILAWKSARETSSANLVLLLTAFVTALLLHVRRLAAAARDYKAATSGYDFARYVAAPRLAGLEQALVCATVFLFLYLLTPMFSGLFLPVAPR